MKTGRKPTTPPLPGTKLTPEQKWRAHKKERFLASYKKTGGVFTAAAAVDISANAVWEWRQTDPEFDAAFNALKEKDTETLEHVAKARATKKSDLLLMFLLKGRRPETYRDSVKLEHSGAIVAATADLSSLPREKLQALVDRLLADEAVDGAGKPDNAKEAKGE